MKIKVLAIAIMLTMASFGDEMKILSSALSASVPANTTFVDGSSVSAAVKIDYGPFDWDKECVVRLNDAKILQSNQRGSYTWQPQKAGVNTLVWSSGGVAITSKVDVVSLNYTPAPTPNPPMDVVSTIAITPTTREIAQTGGGAAILTSGSGDWTAAVSDSWITLNSTTGTAGYPVAYTVSVNPDVEDRVGYVYVAGYTHTITQKGLGCAVDKTNVEVERDQIEGTVTITPTDTRSSWNARPNCDWISVSPTSGTGPGTVTYQVAPWYDVSTRSGTITVGGKTITIFQYGSRMKLEETSYKCDYYSHVAPIKVDALAITEWSVTPNASWLSVVDAGNGRGGDMVSIAVAENPSYKERVGTVTIGTEHFTIMQEGRTALEFSVTPDTTTASVSGANGLASVLGTPDLPWEATCDANWITILPAFKQGAGNGNVVYSVSPQSTLYDRTGTITVTPEAKSGLLPKTHKVTQPAATSALSMSGYEFAASGESVAIEVTVNDIVEWKTVESLDWLSVVGAVDRVGPGTVTLMASANDTIYPREATIKIAEKNFKVVQKGRGVEIEYDNKLFKTDGGMESISIHPDGNVAWTAVASDPTWIIIYQNDSGTGDAEIMYIIAPYTGDGSPRTGTITVGDKVVYITQRAYDLDITPKGEWVTGNAGAGEIGVAASIGDVWSAIVTEPWITIVTGYDAGTGSGTVRFTYTDNDTGKTRTGKIIVAGEVYTLTQAARIMVPITTKVDGHGGSVTGGGSYTSGEKVTLTAVPDSGYEFLYWTGDAGETMQNPIELTADVAKRVTAHFGALTPEFVSAESSTEGVTLTWTSLAWATEYKIYRAPTSEFPTKEIAVVQADGACTFLDTTGEVGTSYFYWVEAIGADDTTESKNAATGMKKSPIVFSVITYTNLMGATHTNPAQYQEGTMVTFAPPSEVEGYTFTGWTPAMITGTMTGPQAVQANWVKKETPPDPPAHTPPTWTQVNKEDTMVVYATVYDKQAKGNIEANGALLGAFDAAGECRGVATIMDGPVGKLFQLSIGVESATEKGLILKVWDPTTGETTEIAERVDCNAEKQIGQIFAPVMFEIGALEMSVAINTGWNWMSIGLVPEDNKISAVLSGATFANGDIVKSVNATATYYNGLWYPATFTIEPGKAYMVKKTAGGEETIVVSGASAESMIEVAAGWNWIGSPLLSAQDVNSISHSAGFTNGDMIKSVSKSATYYNGQWYPSDFAIEPGIGYKAKVAKPGTLMFVELTSKARKAAASFLSAPSSKFSAPTFKPVAQEDTMVVYATIVDGSGAAIEAEGSILVAFAADGECRGVTEIMAGPLGKLYQLSVGVTSATEKGFTLKVWNAANGKLLEVEESIDSNTDKQIGQIFAPVTYHTKNASVVAPSVEGDGAAEVTGDAETGFVVKPSAGTAEVVVTIPEGVAAETVTIEVSTSVQSIKANGATIKVVKGAADITAFLDIPAAVDGVVNLGAAVVKPEIVKEVLDPAKGAVISLSAENPTLTTTETKPGLTYTLVEGATLESMLDGDSKVGDGSKWTPEITVKGGASGFYTIKVTK